MPPLLQLQKLQGKGDGGWGKMSLRHFLADQKLTSSWKKMCFGASYSTSNKLLLVARYVLTMGLQNVFKVELAG